MASTRALFSATEALACSIFCLACVLTVLSEKLWPRSLFGVKREEDERVLTRVAKTEEKEEPQRIDVAFDRRRP